MDIKPVLTKSLSSEDLTKLNLMSFHLKTPPEQKIRKFFIREDASSTFYNTKDLHTKNFYRPTSLIIPIKYYDKF